MIDEAFKEPVDLEKQTAFLWRVASGSVFDDFEHAPDSQHRVGARSTLYNSAQVVEVSLKPFNLFESVSGLLNKQCHS